MITGIGIRNFKSFSEYTEIPFGNITLFSGLNSSGKSTIYQAILLLQQSFGYNFYDIKGNKLPFLKLNGSLVTLGTNSEILSDENDKSIYFYFKINEKSKIEYTFSLPENEQSTGYNEELGINFFLSKIKYTTHNKIGSYCVSLKNDTWEISANEILSFSSYDLSNILQKHGLSIVKNKLKIHNDTSEDERFCKICRIFKNNVTFSNALCIDISDRKLNKFNIHFEDMKCAYLEEIQEHIDFEEIKEQMYDQSIHLEQITLLNTTSLQDEHHTPTIEKTIHIPPFRGLPKRIYLDPEETPLSGYNRIRNTYINYAYDIENNKPIKGSLKQAINYWLVEKFKLAEKVKIQETIPGISTEIFIQISGKYTPINNVGFGTSQLIPTIFKILSGLNNNIYIVDEPETHLHPSIQSILADFFLQLALTGKHIIIETHSEYLIDKMIFNCVKYQDTSDKIKMYWVNKKNGSSNLESISFDELGFIKNQPEGFLNEKKKMVEELNNIRIARLSNGQ
ncbi:AAA family ATPase [Desulfovibrio subterraneus]|nr:AAA family ATPase [Desulfovibrio subterraneus]